MARTSTPWALRRVKDSTAVPSGSLPKGARVTAGLPAARAAGSGLALRRGRAAGCEQQDAGHGETRTTCISSITSAALSLSPIDRHPIIPSYHMARAHPASPTDYGYPRGGLHGQVVHAIGRRILSGAIRPGELLPADPALRASRTVLREAIKVLAAKGLVESRPKTGTRVRPPESWNLLDPDVLAWQQEGTPQPVFLRKLTEVRLIIEPAAAERAALRAAPRRAGGAGGGLRRRWRRPWPARRWTTKPSTRRTSASTARSCRPATTTCSSR